MLCIQARGPYIRYPFMMVKISSPCCEATVPSRRRSFGRLTVRLRTMSCYRSTRISVASANLGTSSERRYRKIAERINMSSNKWRKI